MIVGAVENQDTASSRRPRIGFQKELREGFHFSNTAHLFIQLRQLNNMHVIVEFEYLFEVLGLDTMTSLAHLAVGRQHRRPEILVIVDVRV